MKYSSVNKCLCASALLLSATSANAVLVMWNTTGSDITSATGTLPGSTVTATTTSANTPSTFLIRDALPGTNLRFRENNAASNTPGTLSFDFGQSVTNVVVSISSLRGGNTSPAQIGNFTGSPTFGNFSNINATQAAMNIFQAQTEASGSQASFTADYGSATLTSLSFDLIQLTNVGGTQSAILTIDATPIPEPSSGLLAGLGVLLIARRKRA